MASFTNPWVAASTSILDTLAQRDAAQRLEAERQAEAARLAEEMELRRRQIASAEENTRSLIAAREAEQRWREEEAARRRAEAERQRQMEAATQQDLAGLIEMYYVAQDPKDRAKIATQIQMRGGRVVEPEAPARPRNLAEALMMGDEEAVNAFKRAAQFEQGLRSAGRGAGDPEIDPELPPSFRTYLDTLPTKLDPETGQYYSFERAVDEVRRVFARSAQDGTTGTINQAKALAYLRNIFPEREVVTGVDPMGEPITRRMRPGTGGWQAGASAPAAPAGPTDQPAPPPTTGPANMMVKMKAPDGRDLIVPLYDVPRMQSLGAIVVIE